MSWLDIVWLIIIFLFVIRGVVRGLFREAFGLGGIFIGLIVAINRYEVMGDILASEFTSISPRTAKLASFAVIFIGVALLGGLLGIIFHKACKYSLAKGVDQGGGLFLGLIEGSLICSIVLVLLTISPFSENTNKWMRGSTLSPYLMKVGPFVYDGITSLVPGEAKKFMERLDEFRLIPSPLPSPQRGED